MLIESRRGILRKQVFQLGKINKDWHTEFTALTVEVVVIQFMYTMLKFVHKTGTIR